MCGILFTTLARPLEGEYIKAKADALTELSFEGLARSVNRGKDGGCGVVFYTPNQKNVLNSFKTKKEASDLYMLFKEISDEYNIVGEPHAFLGHLRYRTEGAVTPENMHPILLNNSKSHENFDDIKTTAKRLTVSYSALDKEDISLAMVVNGEHYFQDNLNSSSKIANKIFNGYEEKNNLETVLSDVYNEIFDYGMISAAGILNDGKNNVSKLFYIVDGGRPFSIARIDDVIMGISESVYPQTVKNRGKHKVNEIKLIHGGAIGVQDLVTKELITYRMERRKSHCFFEDIYFKSHNSRMGDGVSPEKTVARYRRAIGRSLAQEHPAPSGRKVVITPVPQSGNSYAHGYSSETGVPIEETISRSPLTKEERTFIVSQHQKNRESSAMLKFEVSEDCEDKIVVVIDDSLVRGTNSRSIYTKLKNAGVKEAHLRIACPPIFFPCKSGINIAAGDTIVEKLGFTPSEIIHDHSPIEKKIAETNGWDSVGYLSVKSLANAAGYNSCMGCIIGTYPYKWKDMKNFGCNFIASEEYGNFIKENFCKK